LHGGPIGFHDSISDAQFGTRCDVEKFGGTGVGHFEADVNFDLGGESGGGGVAKDS
jgi:hypothetical protein